MDTERTGDGDTDETGMGGDPAGRHSSRRLVHSGELFGAATEIGIVHAGEIYRLRITRQGKLILNK